MDDAFKGPDKRLVVGTIFDPPMEDVLFSVASLARRTAMTPRLVHVIEPSQLRLAILAHSEAYLSAQIAEIIERDMLEDAEIKMAALAQKTSAGQPVETRVLKGLPGDSLIAEAIACRASLTVVGLREASYKAIPRGFSTVLTLLAESPLPVMVLPQRRVSFDKTKLRLLIADDLAEKSLGALSTAIEMAICLSPVELVHLHIHPHTEEEFFKWTALIDRELARTAPGWKSKVAREYGFQDNVQSIHASLERRVGFAKELMAASGASYRNDIAFGDVRTKLNEYIDSYDPDIIFFGRHAALHRRPLGIGKLPFHAMLAAGRPLVIAPSRHQ